MKMTKRIFAFLLILAMLLSSFSVVTAAATDYKDVSKKHWAKADIEWATAQGLMNGTGTGKFSPEGSAERAMLVTILYRSAGSPAVGASTPFTDLKQAWYKSAVAWAYTNGIVNGTSATTFGPSAKITREQLATILYRYTKNTLKYNATVSGSLGKFPDSNKVSAYAKEGMLWANAVGLVNGNLKGGVSYLEPKGNATRAQLAAIFHRFENYKAANKPAEPKPTPTPTPTPQKVTIPDLLGKNAEEAKTAVKNLGLYAATVNGKFDPSKGENVVLAQKPAAGTEGNPGDTVTLTINKKPDPFEVPNFVGLDQGAANAKAMEAGLLLNVTVNPYHLDRIPGKVFSQTPASGKVEYASAVQVTVNGAPQSITLPNFIGRTEEDVRTAAAELQIKVQFNTTPYDMSYPAGAVCAQAAEGAFMQGETLNLTVNGQPQTVQLPDLYGKEPQQAIALLEALEVGGEVSLRPYNKNHPAGLVMEQNPVGGNVVLQGTKVQLIVNGEPQQITLPDFTGMTQAQALARANELELKALFREGDYVMTLDEGVVLTQSAPQGSLILQGEEVTLVVNGAPRIVAAPNLRGMTESDALEALATLQLRGEGTTLPYNRSYLPLTVIGQGTQAGNGVLQGSVVAYQLNGEPQNITLPDFTGMTQAQAREKADELQIEIDFQGGTYSVDYPEGAIIAQGNGAGTAFLQGQRLTLTVNGEPALVTLPDFRNMTREEALQAAHELELNVNFTQGSFQLDFAPDTVYIQSPAPESSVPQGMTLELTLAAQPCEVEVPNLVGMSPEEAVAAARSACLRVEYTADSKEEEEGARIITQTPAAGSSLLQGSVLTLKAGERHSGLITLSAYNVELCKTNGVFDYDAYAAEIKKVGGDIVALTKVERDSSRTENVDQVKLLAEKAGYPYYYFGPALIEEKKFVGEYGSGILSKYPIEATHALFNTQDGVEPRGYVRAEVDLGGKILTVYSVHLTYEKAGAVSIQPQQLEELMARCATDENPVVMGVLNLEPHQFGSSILEQMVALNQGDHTYFPGEGESYAYTNIIVPKTFNVLKGTGSQTGFRMTDGTLGTERHCFAYVTTGEDFPELTEVPLLTGKTRKEAEEILKALGIPYKISVNYNPAYGYNCISSQSVDGNLCVPKEKLSMLELGYNEDYTGYLRVATYNVWRFRKKNANGSGVNAMDEIAAEIKQIDPDIIGFQEVTSAQIPAIAKKLGYPYYHFTLAYEGHDYGHGIISKYPITKAEKVMYATQQPKQDETRAYGKFAIDVCGTEVMVYNTHLCLKTEQIVAQFNEVYTDLLTYCKQEGDQYALLMGDMNATPKAFTKYYDMVMTTPLNGSKSLKATEVTFPGGDAIDQILVTDTFKHYEEENGLGLIVNHSPYSDHNMAYTFLQIPPKQAHSGPLTVASLTASRCVDSDGNVNYPLFAAELNAVNADVVALQNIIRKLDGTENQPKILAEQAGFPYYTFFPTVTNKTEEYGIALLSKYPMRAVGQAFTTQDTKEKRGFIRAEVNLGDRAVTVYGMHGSTEGATYLHPQLTEIFDRMQRDTNPIMAGMPYASPADYASVIPENFNALNGGKDMDHIQSANYSILRMNIIVKEPIAAIGDSSAPTGFRYRKNEKIGHTMAYARLLLHRDESGDYLTVPDLRGIDKTEAEALAKAAGFTVSEIVPNANPLYQVDQITSQSLSAGTVVKKADAVLSLGYHSDLIGSLTVATYNVNAFQVGTYAAEINYAMFGRVLKKVDADLVALQRLDRNTTRSGGLDQVKEVAKESGYPYYYFAGLMPYKGGEYGIALLSKHPFTATHGNFTVASGKDKEWGYIRAEVDLGNRTVVAYSVRTTNEAQVGEMNALLEKDPGAIAFGSLGISVDDVNKNLPAGYSSVNQGKNTTTAVRHLHVLYPTELMDVITDETAPDGLRNEDTGLYSSREAYAHLYFKKEGAPKTVTLPDFRGMTKEEAQLLAKRLGIQLEIVEKTNDGYGFNQISAQSEQAGSAFPVDRRLVLEHNADYTGWLKVISYNVKDFTYDGGDCKQGAIQYDTIAAQLRASDADIVGLQEIDKGAKRSDYGYQMEIIAEKTGYPYYYFAKTIDLKSGGEYGHGILSKYPITASSVHFFDSQSDEIRNVERHELNVNGTTVVFYNTHLNGTTDQFAEIQELMKKDEYAILTGDMNFMPTALDTVLDQTKFTALNGIDSHQRLITTTESYKCIDNIVVTNNFEHYADANGCGIFVNPSDYSDHRMITTYLKMK